MARKVFISFLGTNNYVECYYSIDEDYPVRFVQEVLIRNTCKDWTAEDRIFIFCTEEAERRNWFDNGHENTSEAIEKIGLETRLNNLNFVTPVEEVLIDDGFSEDGIWKIFNTVYEKLKDGDEIYFDVTHAFRSIPLFSTVLFNYSRFMLETKIISIQYGAFEKLGSAYLVKNKPLSERGIAPILDLTDIVRLQEYTELASNLINFGKTKQLSTKIQSADNDNNILNDLSQAVSDLDEYIATNQLSQIREGKFIAKFRKNIKPGAKKQPAPIKEILEKIRTETKDFNSKKDNCNIEAAIKWAKNHEMLAQAYSLAEEYIVLRISEIYESLNPFKNKEKANNKAKKKFREYISQVLGLPEKDAKNHDEFHGVLAEGKEIFDKLWQENLIQEIRPEYDKIRTRRNSIIHGNGEFTYENLNSEFDSLYNKCISIINSFRQSV